MKESKRKKQNNNKRSLKNSCKRTRRIEMPVIPWKQILEKFTLAQISENW